MPRVRAGSPTQRAGAIRPEESGKAGQYASPTRHQAPAADTKMPARHPHYLDGIQAGNFKLFFLDRGTAQRGPCLHNKVILCAYAGGLTSVLPLMVLSRGRKLSDQISQKYLLWSRVRDLTDSVGYTKKSDLCLAIGFCWMRQRE
jgi:hypothetical protein